MMSANNDPLAQGGQPAKHYDEQEEFEYDDDNDEHDNDQSRQNNEDDEDEGEAERVQTSGTMLSGQQASMTTSGVASSDHVGRAVSLEERRKLRDVQAYADKINYSSRYSDDIWEYRHVTMPKELAKHVPSDRLMPEEEWRGLGVRQSLGWEHYLIHKPEPHVLLFRREKDYQIKYPNGKPPTNHGVLGKAGGLAH